ncbi:aromatic ring-hydroxylating dioxygenase subunit alpha [Rhizobium sp. FKY42]|uniref:aromatic ring-hydroxylating dioxygenase subunit alpha n=1 Tax=Rhizobium sp. FKY42 TaxID=2562310 RepID=UPI0010C1123D|nr:aromatic ring-hydroxylating dioxygenase subunit alpha [Rhizobium sp. FKY42]
MAFLMNAWYCAAWTEELETEDRFARKLLGKSVLIFKKQDGTYGAIGNACPHRFAPLNKGPREGDTFICPYHGLEFDTNGRCTRNPNEGGTIPRAARVPSYPLVERDSALWIWMGDPKKADLDLIPDFSMIRAREGWNVVRGHHVTKANYELVMDNLMDRTHVQFLHPLLKLMGEQPENFQRIQSVEQIGNMIWDYHGEVNCTKYPLLDALWPEAPDIVENYFDVRWEAPSNMLLNAGTVEVGTNREVGVHLPMSNLLTPADEFSTHYFWSQARDKNIGREEMDEMIKAGVAHTFQNEDGEMVADCMEMMGTNDLMRLNPVMLPGDAAAVRARRILSSMIAAEQAEAGLV